MSDPRLTPARSDLASRALEGVVASATYVDPRAMSVIVPALGVLAAPDLASQQLDQALFGEVFEVLTTAGDFAWGQARRDGYVGYVPLGNLGSLNEAATHRVNAIRTYAFADPSIKACANGPYSLNSLITVEAQEGRFAKAAGGGWFIAEHLAPVGRFESDWVEVAQRFLGAAYLWGGREAQGLDCSGLVQQARMAAGHACPRDTDMQQQLGAEISPGDLTRGDLVFWRGHVGIMLDESRLLHANAHHMATAIEPLAEAVARIAAGPTGMPTGYRRL